MAMNYYNEEFNVDKHANKLPPSARLVSGANDYLFPTELSEDVMENVAFRFYFAPNVSTYFSSEGILTDLGFSLEQIGGRTAQKQIRMGNQNTEYFSSEVADNVFRKELTSKATLFKATIKLNYKNYITSITKVQMKRRDSFAIENYKTAVNNMFTEMGKKTNPENS